MRAAPLPLRPLTVLVPLLLVAAGVPAPAGAQAATDRPPNISGGWVGEPGTIHFNFLHRFWATEAKINNSPTMLLGVPVHRRVLMGASYATNSLVVGGEFHELELWGRWAPLVEEDGPVGLGLTGAYNAAAESIDGEVALTVPLGRVRVLGAGRAFSDAHRSGEPGWAAAGGLVVHALDNLSLSADVGRLWRDGEWPGEGPVWGAGVQFRIPASPHTLSLQATNTRTGSLQGASGAENSRRTVWGFEFTIPMVLSRYIPGLRPSRPEQEPPPGAAEGEVRVTMTEDLRFVPDTLRIEAGQTVVWENPTELVHTVTADPEVVRDPEMVSLPEGAETFDSGNMFTGDEFTQTFEVVGQYDYVCIPHDMVGMVGVVIVEEPAR